MDQNGVIQPLLTGDLKAEFIKKINMFNIFRFGRFFRQE